MRFVPCPQSEVCAANEMLVDLGSRELVEAKSLAARTSEGRARAQRQFHSPFQAQAASVQLRERPVEVGDPVQEDRRVAGQVIGEQ